METNEHTTHTTSKKRSDRLYLPQKIRGRGLLQIAKKDKRSLNDYICANREKFLKAVKMKNILKTTEKKAQYKKNYFFKN